MGVQSRGRLTDPPKGPLDFYTGTAELLIAGLLYRNTIPSILRYDDTDIIVAVPGENGEPGKLSAVFADENGEIVFELKENHWVGANTNWDIEVKGPRIKIRTEKSKIAFQVRLDPPGRLILERLDMRIGNHHLLASEVTFSVGLYIGSKQLAWVHAPAEITGGLPGGAVIQLFSYERIKENLALPAPTSGLRTADGFFSSSSEGISFKRHGVVIGYKTGGIHEYSCATGFRTLKEMRRLFRSGPSQRDVNEFLGGSTYTP